MRGNKNCWATGVVDEATAIEAAVLAKSLARVVTLADTIVFIPLDISDSIAKMLTNFFDVVLPVDLPKGEVDQGLSRKDRLLISSWVLGMYEKCIVVDSKTIVLINCDELFELDCDLAAAKTEGVQNYYDFNVCVIQPCHRTNKKLLEMTTSENFSNLSQLMNSYITEYKPRYTDLPRIYNFNTLNPISNPFLDEVKIFTFPNCTILKLHGFTDSAVNDTQIFKNIWMSFYNEIQEKMPPSIFSKNTCEMNERDEIFNEELFNKRSYYRDSIALIGHSCRLPGSNNIEEFWNLLKNAETGIIPCPPDRLTDEERYDQKYIDSRAGFLKCRIDEFDAKFFGISPREAAIMDPQQRLLVEVAWEALENAAIDPTSLKGSNTAVFTGIWCHDYEHLLVENTSGFNFNHIVLGNAFSATSARISYILGLNGPNVATESACSSSFGALHLACESLRRGETNLGLVCGANIMISQVSLLEIPILANDGQCKTFDEKADGFGRAEGIAVLIVKRLTDAIRDGDRIMGVVRGSAISQEGTTSSFGTPSKHCQEIAVKGAIKNARVKPGEVDYVEAHGTGTPVGDPIEFAALSAGYTGERDKPLIIGSVKTNTGHTESTAGLTSIIKVVLSMKHEMIPKHRNFDVLNPNINLDIIPAVIPVESVKWPRNPDRVRIAGISSFGISGTNVHAILEEPPSDSYFQTRHLNLIESDRTHHILTLSAKTENALKDLSNKYIEYFHKNPTENISDIAFTVNTGKAHHKKYRRFVIGENITDFKSSLEKYEHHTNTPLLNANPTPKIGFLFTGQGSQYFGMGKELYVSNLVFREAFRKCANIIENNVGISIRDALWSESHKNLIDETIYSQLTIFSLGYSLLKLWESLGVKPDFLLGHSVGEFVAAVAADILILEDAIKLLSERSKLIQKLPGGGMLAVRCSKEKVSQLISEWLKNNSVSSKWLDIAVVNSEDSVVVAGTNNAINSFNEFCVTKGVKATKLAASHAFHSRGIEGAMEEFGQFAKTIPYNFPKCVYISGTTGETLNGPMNAAYWQRHARETINFSKGMTTLSQTGCNIFIEIGAHPVLLALGISNVSNPESCLWIPSIRRNENNWQTLLTSLGNLYVNNLDISWKSLDKSIIRKKLEMPSYPFQRQVYWAEITKENPGKPLHPILGFKVPLANVKDIVYQNTMDVKDFHYLLDHQVAHVAVFPGAGYLETFLAVGRDQFKTNEDEIIKVEEFVVESPFEIVEHRKTKIQVVASPVSTDSESHGNKRTLSVKFYSYANLNGYNDEKGWKLHARANISLSDAGDAVDKYRNEILTPDDIKLRCPLEKDSVDYYAPAAEIGIHFGDTFQCIETNWTRKGEALAKIPLPSKAGSLKEYIYHPIILDAMIQSFGISVGDENSALYLPIGMEKFLMFSKDSLSNSEFFYAHAKWEHGKTTANIGLYNEQNQLLGFMQGVRLLQTSASSFLNVINGEKNVLPGMYQEMWKLKDVGPQQSRMNIGQVENPEKILHNLHLSMESKMEDFNSEIEVLENVLMSLTIVSGLKLAGWNIQLGEIFDTQSVMESLLFSYSHSSYVDRIFEIICEDGYTVELPGGEAGTKQWKLIKQFPNSEQIHKKQNELLEIIYSRSPEEKNMVTELAVNSSANLIKVLQGKETAVSALFSGEGYDPLNLYTNPIESRLANERTVKYLEMTLGNKLRDGCPDEGSIVRIIEIGAGTGATTKQILETLQTLGIQFRYTFTDISPFFLETAKKTFSEIIGIEYKVLDIEKEPTSQGFCPHHYDIVVAANVIHATENLNNSMHNVRRLLVPHGLVILQEKLRPMRTFDVLFGLLDGYWKFNDYDLRKSHPTAPKDIWDRVFLENNFSASQLLSREDESTSILVSRANSVAKIESKSIVNSVNVKKPAWFVFGDEGAIENILVQKLALENFVIKIGRSDKTQKEFTQLENSISLNMPDADLIPHAMNDLCKNYDVIGIVLLYSLNNDTLTNPDDIYLRTLNICKFVSASVKSPIKFCVASRGAQFVPNQDLVFPAMSPVLGMVKSLANEVPTIQFKVIDLDPDDTNESLESEELFYELFSLDESSVCYRHRKRFVQRMVTMPKQKVPLSLPQGHYKIEIPISKKIDDVYFKNYNEAKLRPEEAEVELKATSLNFRDVFVILKPETFKSAFNAVGTEFSGIVSRIGSSVSKFKVGDEVFGFYNTSCAGSHVVLEAKKLMAKPKNFTFAEASTIPFVFFTAYHCLVGVANLRKDETVLIHVASGGVGLVAIQIAQNIGAKIIATAGSHRKRTYLRSIGIEHVFHSRDTTFEKDIQKVTNGRGVDVVLNSLTGPGFVESSLKCCASGARFVEMAKLNIWKPENVQNLRPDVQYSIVNMEDVEITGIIPLLMSVLQDFIQKGVIYPLPYSRYEITHIKDALNYLLKAQHIGKIVVAMPEVKQTNGVRFNNELIFNSNSTYIITGGLGGIGLEVAKWMADSGAKNIVLVGRSSPNENALQAINQLKNIGCRVLTAQIDIGNIKQCKELFDMISNPDSRLPPLKGVIHSAGVLSDAVFTNQTWEKYQVVYNAKVKGGWNLHELTKDMNLECFVLFSSMAAVMFPVGQSNHGSANLFLDSLAHYRHSIGLPSLTINWGVWSEVGAAIDTAYVKDGAFGVKPFSPKQGIAALKFAMTRPNLVQLGVLQLDAAIFKQTAYFNSGIMSLLEDENDNEAQTQSNALSEKFMTEISSLTVEERILCFKTRLETIVRKTLKLSETDAIDEHQQFSELGLDSLMAVEMKNKLQAMVGKSVTLNSTSLLDYPTIGSLSKYLAEATAGDTNTVNQGKKETTDLSESYELVKSDSVLPNDIKATMGNKIVAKNEIENVLVTGSTGQLGGYILKDLLANNSLNIYCLIRGRNISQAKEKLVANLKKYQLTKLVDISKVTFILGNIVEERFGLSTEEYQNLCSKIDCVFHLAAKVNHTEVYQARKSNVDIRHVNVMGTTNVLRFCSNIKTKQMVFASTYPAINRLTPDGFASDEFPDSYNYGDGITEGYFLSKFVCEKLVGEAVSRGIPCTCIRYPILAGDSITGHFTVDTNLFMNLSLVSSRLGIFPDIKGGVNILPVDVASKLTMELVFNDNTEIGVYNLLHTDPLYSKDIVEMAMRAGHKMKIVSEDEYFEAFNKESESNSFLRFFTEQYGDSSFLLDLSGTLTLSMKSEKNIYRFSEKFLKAIPDIRQKIPKTRILLALYFEYANSSGIAKKYGISVTK